MSNKSCQLVPFPKTRRLMVDGGHMARQKHLIHGLVEMDVTHIRRLIRVHKARTGEALSFTAFIMACLGQVVERNKHIQAVRTWRETLAIFDDVDVNTMFEVEVDGRKIIRPHIVRTVNRKTLREIHEEIRTFQTNHEHGREAKFINRFVLLPAFIRRFFLGILFKSPQMLKDMNGTVSLTAVGMFGNGGGWGIPVSNHTLQLTLGGLAEKPVLKDGQLENHEFLCVTISIDHDIVDGAPAARFIQQLKELVENGYGIEEFIKKTEA